MTSKDQCEFPGCVEPVDPDPDNGMCKVHRLVRVSGSYVNDKHADGGHG